MKRIAVFGNAGAGKSTTSQKISVLTGIPLYVLDKIKYSTGGNEIAHENYLSLHAQILDQEQWIIDGYGCLKTTWERLNKADTLVYIDLPLFVHFFWVGKRFVKGLFSAPEGWPDKTPLIKSTLNSYRVLWLCHKQLTPQYRTFIAQAKNTKHVFHLRSKSDIKAFLKSLKSQNT